MKLRDRKKIAKPKVDNTPTITKKRRRRTPLKKKLKKEIDDDMKVPKIEPVDPEYEDKSYIRDSIRKLVNESLKDSVKELVGVKTEIDETGNSTEHSNSSYFNNNNNNNNNNTIEATNNIHNYINFNYNNNNNNNINNNNRDNNSNKNNNIINNNVNNNNDNSNYNDNMNGKNNNGNDNDNNNQNIINKNDLKKVAETENDQEILNELINGTFDETFGGEEESNDLDDNENEENLSENEDLIDEEEFSEYYDSEENDFYTEKKGKNKRKSSRKGKAPMNSEEEEEEEEEEGEEENDNEYSGNKDEDEEIDNENTQIPQKVGEWLFEANKSVGGRNSQFAEYSKDFWIDEDEIDQDQEDDLKDLEEEMEEEGKRKRKRKRSGKDSKLSDENGKLLGKANVAYSNKQYQEAIQYLHSIIQSAPNANQAWFLLAIIHEELGEELKAFQFYLVAAHITKKDGSLWKRLGLMAKNLNQIEEAIYCYTKAIHTDNKDFDAVWDRSYLYYEQGNYKKAINGYIYILKYCPNNTHVIKELSKLYLKTNNVEKAIILFENAIKASDEEQELYKKHLLEKERLKAEKENGINNTKESEKGFFDDDPNKLQPIITSDDEEDDFQFECSIGYEEINMLAELYMEINEYEKAINTIRKRCRILQGKEIPEKENMMDDSEFDEDENTPEHQRLPMELRVRLGICRLYLNQINLAVVNI